MSIFIDKNEPIEIPLHQILDYTFKGKITYHQNRSSQQQGITTFYTKDGEEIQFDIYTMELINNKNPDILIALDRVIKTLDNPNAFVPNGVNNIFKPVLIYGTADGYNMKVINRYGEVIFETDDINEGWLGTYNNKTVELGSYGYVITFTATNGQVITKKGNVTVVR